MRTVNGIQQGPQERENVLFGIVGAFLFSLVGGALWYVLYQVGFLAGISGIVGVICAIKGYSVFAKRESKKGVILSVIIAALVIVAAWYLCLANDVYVAYQEWYAAGEIDFTLTFFESVQYAYLFLEEPEIATGYFTDLAIGLGLCVLGAAHNVIEAFKRVDTVAMPQPEVAPAEWEEIGNESKTVVTSATLNGEPVTEDAE